MTEPLPVSLPQGELETLLQPFDRHNRALLSNVHPPRWVNPRPADRYHLVVIGGGTAGLISAAIAAGLGARVALVERRLLGGDCLNYGCVPSKALIRAARAWHEARHGAERFGAPPVVGRGDFQRVMERMRDLRARISHNDSASRFRDLGVDVFIGEARFEAADCVEVDGARLRFRKAIVAAGARPVAPPIPGLDTVRYYTNETFFTLTELPARLGVIGGGPIGCEMAQSFARFGSQVTLFDLATHVLVREDTDAACTVQDAMVADGVHLELEAQVLGVAAQGDSKLVTLEQDGEERSVEVDELLVAVGRAPNVEGLGLEAAGIDYDRRGVTVDDRLRTTNHRVFAVGDIASRFKFTHMAEALAGIAVQNALFFGRAKASRLVVPWCTYTSPEIAHVGLYKHQAEEAGIAVDSLTVPLSEVDRAILDGAEEGFLRVHLEQGTDKILGATLVAEHAGDMLSELTLAITSGLGLGAIAGVIHPYPTQAEVIKRVANAWRKRKLTPAAKRAFGLWFRVFR